ncbi:MAG: hypothetical protein Q8O76_11595, partial [Chloroflexota bacterium]|nr:hypothetical protein [Chloroflexota bacterium]
RSVGRSRCREKLRHLGVEQGSRPVEMFVVLEDRFRTISVSCSLSRRFFANMKQLPAMLRRGKLPLWPSGTRGAKELKAIFDRVEAEERSMSGTGAR